MNNGTCLQDRVTCDILEVFQTHLTNVFKWIRCLEFCFFMFLLCKNMQVKLCCFIKSNCFSSGKPWLAEYSAENRPKIYTRSLNVLLF